MNNKSKSVIIVVVAAVIATMLCIPFTTAYINPSSKIIDDFSKIYSSVTFDSTPEEIDELLSSNLKVLDKQVNEDSDDYQITYRISGYWICCEFFESHLKSVLFFNETEKYGSNKVCYEKLPSKHKQKFEQLTDTMLIDETTRTEEQSTLFTFLYKYEDRPILLTVSAYEEYLGSLKIRCCCNVNIRMENDLLSKGWALEK